MKHPTEPINHWALATLLLGALATTTAGATDITYTVDETITGPIQGVPTNSTQINTDEVVGSITTDGTIGYIHTGNLVSWNLDLIDVTNPANSYDLTNSNSLISLDIGQVLNASATGLSFNFSGTGAFGFQADVPGQYSGYHYWCLSINETWACLDGNSIAPNNVYTNSGGDDLVVAAAGTQGQTGISPLNQPPSVPEPSTLLLLGFGLIAGIKRALKGGKA